MNIRLNILTTVDIQNPTLEKLQHVDLSWNKLPQFYLVNIQLPELVYINLSHNQFSEFVVFRAVLPKLLELHASNNSLRQIDLRWLEMPAVQQLSFGM